MAVTAHGKSLACWLRRGPRAETWTRILIQRRITEGSELVAENRREATSIQCRNLEDQGPLLKDLSRLFWGGRGNLTHSNVASIFRFQYRVD